MVDRQRRVRLSWLRERRLPFADQGPTDPAERAHVSRKGRAVTGDRKRCDPSRRSDAARHQELPRLWNGLLGDAEAGLSLPGVPGRELEYREDTGRRLAFVH